MSLFRSNQRLLETRMRRSVIVHRPGQDSIRGVLIGEYEDGLALRHAQLLPDPDKPGESSPPPVDLVGDILIPSTPGWFVQDVSATTAFAEHRLITSQK